MLEFWRKPYLNLQSTKYYFKNNFNQAFHWRRPTGPQSLTHLCDSEGLRMGEPVTALTFFIFLFGIIKFNASLCGASVFSFLLLPFWLPWPQSPDRVTGAETGWHWATGSHRSHSELYTGHGEDLLFRLSTVGSRVMVNSWLNDPMKERTPIWVCSVLGVICSSQAHWLFSCLIHCMGDASHSHRPLMLRHHILLHMFRPMLPPDSAEWQLANTRCF